MSISSQDLKEAGRKKGFSFTDPTNLMLAGILVVAALLRFWALDGQSLWLDELHTMNEAAPALSFKKLFYYLTCCDQHPPLYFFAEKLLFIVFGHTSLVARTLSALIGVGSVWLMYLLGKELLSKRLGLIAAAITCVNYFNLLYSQEARDYIMAFFFAALSYLFLFRLIKTGSRKNVWPYALSALAVMYSHYYGLFLVTGEFLTAGFFWIMQPSDRKLLFRNFLIAAIIIIIGYLPWLSFLKDMAAINSFWIGPVDPEFVQNFFFAYFDNSGILKPFLILAIIYFCIRAIRFRSTETLRYSALELSFVGFLITLLTTYGIPYIRSLLVVPMLFDRYTIVILPAIIMVIAMGFDLIESRAIRSALIAAFLVLSLTDILFAKKFYTSIRKTQFRELTEFISSEKKYQYPIINQRTSWQHQYYLNQYHYKGPVLVGQKDALVDSILRKSSPAYDLPGFWIIGAHANETKITDVTKAALDTAYELVKAKDFYDCWAQLYVSRGVLSNQRVVIGPDKFPGNITSMDNERYIGVWGGAVSSLPIPLKAGQYTIDITSRGYASQNIFPHLNVYLGNQLIGNFFVTQDLQEKQFDLEIKKDSDVILKIEMDNDFADASGDRNAFISRIIISKK
jgi:mannosyltransferase